jgi:hypothetical protein
MGCWEEVDIDTLPEDANLIGVKWVFKIKYKNGRLRPSHHTRAKRVFIKEPFSNPGLMTSVGMERPPRCPRILRNRQALEAADRGQAAPSQAAPFLPLHQNHPSIPLSPPRALLGAKPTPRNGKGSKEVPPPPPPPPMATAPDAECPRHRPAGGGASSRRPTRTRCAERGPGERDSERERASGSERDSERGRERRESARVAESERERARAREGEK